MKESGGESKRERDLDKEQKREGGTQRQERGTERD